MTVSPRFRTTIGQLIYPSRPALHFERLVEDLDAALAGCEAGERRVTLVRDDLAIIDAGASRVALAVVEGLDSAGAAAVSITVGYGPEDTGDARLARRQAVLARLIADRVAARFAPAETIWSESFEVATPEFFARHFKELSERQRARLDIRAERTWDRRGTPRHFVDPDDLPRMVARLEATLDARRVKQRGTLAMTNNELSDLPPVDLSGLDDTWEPRKQASAPLRLAAFLIDATVMVLALPLGAAMLVYSLSRGANLNNSARMLAVAGIGIGMMQKVGGLGGLTSVLSRSI